MSYDTDRYSLSRLPSQSLAVIQCGIQICHPGHAAPHLFYKDYSAHFILEGKGVFIRNGLSYELQAGQGFLIIPNTSCEYIADSTDPWKYVYVSFQGADGDALVHNAGLDENNVTFDFPLTDDMVHDIYAMHRAGKKNEAMGYDVIGYFLLVMSRLIRTASAACGEKTGEYYVKRARKYMEDNYAAPIRISDIAAHVRLDRTYLYRLFTQHTGISPSDYLLQIRLTAASRHLENGTLTVREAAANAGFFNMSHFYKKFLEVYGVTPKIYREMRNASHVKQNKP